MLKFEITDAKVWSKASKDTTGLKEFYNANKDKWMWPNRIKGEVYICINADVAKQVKDLLDKGNTLPQVLELVNKSSQLNVRVLQGAYSKEDYPALGTFYWKKGVSDVAESAKMFYVFKIDDILAPQPKKIEEARGIITSAYQNYLEENWMKELRAKYPVAVNNEEYNALLKQK